jgi:putative transposase
MHWVFVAKYRRRVFNAQPVDLLRDIFADVCSDARGTLVQMDVEDDHVHLLVQHPPKMAVSSFVNSLKGVSSRSLRQRRPTSASATGKACSGRQLPRFLLW